MIDSASQLGQKNGMRQSRHTTAPLLPLFLGLLGLGIGGCPCPCGPGATGSAEALDSPPRSIQVWADWLILPPETRTDTLQGFLKDPLPRERNELLARAPKDLPVNLLQAAATTLLDGEMGECGVRRGGAQTLEVRTTLTPRLLSDLRTIQLHYKHRITWPDSAGYDEWTTSVGLADDRYLLVRTLENPVTHETMLLFLRARELESGIGEQGPGT